MSVADYLAGQRCERALLQTRLPKRSHAGRTTLNLVQAAKAAVGARGRAVGAAPPGVGAIAADFASLPEAAVADAAIVAGFVAVAKANAAARKGDLGKMPGVGLAVDTPPVSHFLSRRWPSQSPSQGQRARPM